MDIKARAKKLKQDIPTVFLCLKDADTPFAAKLLAALTVGYALSPIDLIPDFIPVLGYLDDLILLPTMVALTIRCIPQGIWQKTQHCLPECGKTANRKSGIMRCLLCWFGALFFG